MQDLAGACILIDIGLSFLSKKQDAIYFAEQNLAI